MTAVTTESRPTSASTHVPGAWWVAAGACLAIIGAGAFTTMSGLLVQPLATEFSWPRGSIGVAIAVNMVLYGLTAPFAAALMDRVGIRRVVPVAMLLIALGAGLTTVVSAPWQLTLYWGLFVGIGTGSVTMVFAATVANRWFVARRGLVVGLLTASSVLGQFLFLPLLSWIIEQHHWRPGVATIGFAALAISPLVWLMLRDRPADGGAVAVGAHPPNSAVDSNADSGSSVTRRTMGALVAAARTWPFWLLAGTFAICGASTNGVMWSHFTPAAHDHGMPMTSASSLLALIGIFNVVGTVSSGWLTDRIDPRWLLSIFFATRGLSLSLLPLLFASTVSVPMVAFVVVFGILDVATVPPVIALCGERYGADSAIVFGWINAAHQIGAGLMAFLGGAIRDALGSYTTVWIAAAALCEVAALAVLAMPGRGAHLTDPTPLHAA
ncbi:MFS transporter [Antrihabitans spumae]|uniref:MFS transporter n=1 Tax=Antrihabitans spumae TaxID=3373370 RepID=A0ABW7K7J4_9NOCA